MLVGKVTALVVRSSASGHELLLFEHQHAGTQIPAGTIEPGESPEAAALREAAEETGLSHFERVELLGVKEMRLPEAERMTAQPTPLYTRARDRHTYGIELRAGITVRLEREMDGMSQVSYEELGDDEADPYVSYRLTGWVPSSALSEGVQRHFFLLRYDSPTPERWQVETDSHRFSLFWAPLRHIPPLRAPQDSWLDLLPPDLLT